MKVLAFLSRFWHNHMSWPTWKKHLGKENSFPLPLLGGKAITSTNLSLQNVLEQLNPYDEIDTILRDDGHKLGFGLWPLSFLPSPLSRSPHSAASPSHSRQSLKLTTSQSCRPSSSGTQIQSWLSPVCDGPWPQRRAR